jgi:hypothetical protein
LISQSNEPKEWKPQQLGLDRKAMEIATGPRGKLSTGEKRQLDKELLLLLEGNQNLRNAVLGANSFLKNNVGTLSDVMALDRGADPSAQTGGSAKAWKLYTIFCLGN